MQDTKFNKTDFTSEQAWSLLTEIRGTVLRIDERTRDLEISNAKICERYESLSDRVEKFSGLSEKVIRMETPYRVTVWLLGIIGALGIGLIWAVLTHTYEITQIVKP